MLCVINENNNVGQGWMVSPYSLENQIKAANGTYNGGNASRYALDHALEPSSNYVYFTFDCTNFISQCLYAGGIKQHVDLHTRIHAGIIRLAQIDRLHGQEQMNFINI